MLNVSSLKFLILAIKDFQLVKRQSNIILVRKVWVRLEVSETLVTTRFSALGMRQFSSLVIELADKLFLLLIILWYKCPNVNIEVNRGGDLKVRLLVRRRLEYHVEIFLSKHILTSDPSTFDVKWVFQV